MTSFKQKLRSAVLNRSVAEAKVYEATNNDPWGPSAALLREITEYTYHVEGYTDVMMTIWKRLNNHGKNWRHVYKSLMLLDHLVKKGSERVVQQCRDNIFSIHVLKDFQFVDKDGRDQGANVRNKAKDFVAFIQDKERVREERLLARKSRARDNMPTSIGSDTDIGDSRVTTSAEDVATTVHRLPDEVFITRDSDEPTTQLNRQQLENEVKQLQIDRFSNSSDRSYQSVSVTDLTTEKQRETNVQPTATERIEELEKAFVEFRANNEYLKDQLSITQQHLLYVQNTTIDLQNQLSVNKQQLSDLQRDNTYLKNQLSLTQQQLLGVQSMMACSRVWVVSRDHFTIGKEIGRGAWATVHKTTFRGATVAAKCLHHLITSPLTRQLFQREMEMALQCQHQNIVTFLGATLEGPPVILMELMDTSLRSAYEHGNIKDHQVLGILCDTASALHFLHTRPDPVIHRDVSSANVLLKILYNGEWLAKLGDLGTAKIQQQAATAGPGAIAYGAPEAADFTKHSPKMDVYSYGVLVLEVLTKTHPFQMVDALKAQVQQQFPQYRQLVTGCTNHQLSNRPTMYDVIEQLDRIKAARP